MLAFDDPAALVKENVVTMRTRATRWKIRGIHCAAHVRAGPGGGAGSCAPLGTAVIAAILRDRVETVGLCPRCARQPSAPRRTRFTRHGISAARNKPLPCAKARSGLQDAVGEAGDAVNFMICSDVGRLATLLHFACLGATRKPAVGWFAAGATDESGARSPARRGRLWSTRRPPTAVCAIAPGGRPQKSAPNAKDKLLATAWVGRCSRCIGRCW